MSNNSAIEQSPPSELPSLSSIGGDFLIRENELVPLPHTPALSRVGGTLEISGNELIASVAPIQLPALVTTGVDYRYRQRPKHRAGNADPGELWWVLHRRTELYLVDWSLMSVAGIFEVSVEESPAVSAATAEEDTSVVMLTGDAQMRIDLPTGVLEQVRPS